MKRYFLTAGGSARSFSLSLIIVFLILALMSLLWPAAGSAQEPDLPETPPEAAPGMTIFLDRCANCHGPLGMGDGELAAQLPRPPRPIGTEEYLRTAVPAQMFDAVTNGIVAGGMPPFGPASSDPISEENRWNVIAAVYSLGTSSEILEVGQTLYTDSCAECHGSDGVSDALDLSSPAYWMTHSNQDVLDSLNAGSSVSEHQELDLAEEERLAVVDYARSFSYEYASPMEALMADDAFAPIEVATITGQVVNETTGAVLPGGTEVELTAFNADFQPTMTMTTSLDDAGAFAFNLTMVAPDLVYVVTTEYEDISFGSDFAQIERQDPVLEMPVVVYDMTTDASTVSVQQIHAILEFGEGQVRVNELYQFSQMAPLVFIGESGDSSEGTVEVVLPEGATDPAFDRTFGGFDNFFPAENVIQKDGAWADTVPLRPGQGTLNLLVRYTLPYDEAGTTISHPVRYNVDNVNLVIADGGVEMANVEESGWTVQEGGAMGGMFLNYQRPGVPEGQTVEFTLAGEPEPLTDPLASTETGAAPVQERDTTTELLIGGGVLLLAVAAGFYLVRLWQQNQLEPAAAGAPVDVEPDSADEVRRDQLIQAIADLDDAYEAGEIEQPEYERRRQNLKAELLEVW